MNGLIVLALGPRRIPPDGLKRIAEIDGTREVFASGDRKEIEARLADVEIAAGDFPPELLAAAPKLRWYQAWSAGADFLQKFPETKDAPFLLTSTSGMHLEQMNEHLFGLLLAWCRKFPLAFAAQSRKEWYRPRGHFEMVALSGKTMLILGFGAIGEHTARIARAFGMEVIGVRRTERPGEARSDGVRIGTLDQLPSLLPQADIVVNILPMTQDTREMADVAFFSRMKPTALFANIGRGGTVNEADLVAALAGGAIAGAVLDVTAVEPLPPESPLWTRENVIITGHYAGFHPRYDEIAFGIFLDNLSRFAAGNPLLNLVDKRLGY